MNDHILRYPSAKSLGLLHNMGALLGIMMVIQVVTGFFLSTRYYPDAGSAFDIIEALIRDADYADLLRYAHANGASLLFACMYIHICKAVLFKTYGYPRGHVWAIGVIIYVLSVGSAFLGYTLVWGQMSLWALIVITNLISVVPVIGKDLLQFIWGGPCVSGDTLIRMYSLHYLLPFIVLALAGLHLLLLHIPGNGARLSGSVYVYDKIPFAPYFIVKDALSFFMLLVAGVVLVTYAPDMLGHPDNYIEANYCVTPTHIVPEWYLLYWYGVLRSIPNKTAGVIAMALGLVGIALLVVGNAWIGIRALGISVSSTVNTYAHVGISRFTISSTIIALGAFVINAMMAAEIPMYPFTHLGLTASIASLLG